MLWSPTDPTLGLETATRNIQTLQEPIHGPRVWVEPVTHDPDRDTSTDVTPGMNRRATEALSSFLGPF